MRTAVLGFSLAVVLYGVEGRAQLQPPGNHRTQTEIEAHVTLPYSQTWYGTLAGSTAFGVGVRVNIPLVRNGFVRRINNDVALGVGGDLLYNSHATAGLSVMVPVVVQWNLFVAPQWSLEFELGAALGTNNYYLCNPFCARPAVAVGARWHFDSDRGFPALVLRLGWPTGINVGLAF